MAPVAGTPARQLVRTFGLAWLIAFSGAATPGPLLALVIGQVLAQGFAAVLLILLGHALLEVLFIAGFALGLTRVLQRLRVRGVLALVGGLALGWMGFDILLHAGEASLSAAASQALSWPWLIAGGAGVSLSNPYFTGWWATVGTGQMATFGLRRPADYLAFWMGHELGDTVWYAFVAALLAVGRSLLSDAVYQGLLRVCGGVICTLALVFLVLGIRCLRPPRAPVATPAAAAGPSGAAARTTGDGGPDSSAGTASGSG